MQLKLICCEAGKPHSAWQQARLAVFDPGSEILVLTKIDAAEPTVAFQADFPAGAIATSALHAAGLDALRARLATLARKCHEPELPAVGATAVRVAESLQGAAAALTRARALNELASGEELVAAEVRLALDELGKVTGAIATDDVLERIFSRFCIGK